MLVDHDGNIIKSVYEEERACDVCNKKFIPRRNRGGIIATYCSKDCRHWAARKGIIVGSVDLDRSAVNTVKPREPGVYSKSWSARRGVNSLVGDKIEYGKSIKERRQAKGLTVTELANAVGVSRGAVNNWERGLRAPESRKIMNKLTEVLR